MIFCQLPWAEARGDRNGPHTSLGTEAAPAFRPRALRVVVTTSGSLDGRGDPGRAAASRASGKEKRSTGRTNPPSRALRAPGCRLQAWEVQALPGGFCLQGCGLCAVGGGPPSGRGDVAGSLDTAVSLQLPSSCWQPPPTPGLIRGPRRPGARPTWTRAAPASLETVHTRGLSGVIGPRGLRKFLSKTGLLTRGSF